MFLVPKSSYTAPGDGVGDGVGDGIGGGVGADGAGEGTTDSRHGARCAVELTVALAHTLCDLDILEAQQCVSPPGPFSQCVPPQYEPHARQQHTCFWLGCWMPS